MTEQMAAILPQNSIYNSAPQTGINLKALRWAMFAVASAVVLSFAAFLPAQARPHAVDATRTVTNGDLHLAPNEIVEEDVFVMSGNVVLEEGAKIEGDLSVMSGNIDIAADAVIKGDVTSFSGNIKNFGEIRGDVVALSGNIDLFDGSSVRGDATVMSGNLNREPSADVRGDTIKGGGLGRIFSWNDGELEVDIDAAASYADGENSEADDGYTENRRRGRGIFGVIVGILGAIFTTLVWSLVVGGVVLVRPDFIQSIKRRMKSELALCFATGVATNLGLFFLSIVAAITVIGLLAAIPIWILLPLLNLAGAVVAVAVLGDKLLTRFHIDASQTLRYPLRVAIGVAMIAGPLALLWSMGGCFSFIGFLGYLALSTIGTGAIILPWVRRFFGDDFMQRNQNNAYTEEQKPSYDATADDYEDGESEDGESENSGAEDEINVQDININTPPADTEEPVADSADDLTKIRGVGAVFATRLQEAGVTSYAQLAALSIEEVGEIFGWPADRVERDDIIGQAKAMANQ